jgi:Sec-independent protein translocase protein TatA
MDLLGIGIPELIFIFLLALIVFGPRDMVKTGQQVGEFFGNLMRSDFWKAFQTAQREMRSLPNRLAREAGIKDIQRQLESEGKTIAEKPSSVPKPDHENEATLKTSGWIEPYSKDILDDEVGEN